MTGFFTTLGYLALVFFSTLYPAFFRFAAMVMLVIIASYIIA